MIGRSSVLFLGVLCWFRWCCNVALIRNGLDVTLNGTRVKCSVIISGFGLMASSTQKNLCLSQQPRAARRLSQYWRPVLLCVFEVEGGCPYSADRTLDQSRGNHSVMSHLLQLRHHAQHVILSSPCPRGLPHGVACSASHQTLDLQVC